VATNKNRQRDLLIGIGGTLIAVAGPGLSAIYLRGHALEIVLWACLVVGVGMVTLAFVDTGRQRSRDRKHRAQVAEPSTVADEWTPRLSADEMARATQQLAAELGEALGGPPASRRRRP